MAVAASPAHVRSGNSVGKGIDFAPKEAFSSGLESIHEQYLMALRWEHEQEREQHEVLVRFGLQEHEATAWLNNEPDFAKRIAHPHPPNDNDALPNNITLICCRSVQQRLT